MSDELYWSKSEYVYNCLIDNKRTLVFQKAIKEAVKKDDVVVDLGAGSGVLTLFAIQAGAKKVYVVEYDKNLIEQLKNVFAKNNCLDKVEILHGDASKIKLPEKVDVVLCEMIGTGLIDELQIPAMNNILKYTKKDARILPSTFNQYAELVYNRDSFYGHSFPVIRYEFDWHKELQSKTYSKKMLYHSVDFSQHNETDIENEIIFTAKDTGLINAIRISNESSFLGKHKLKSTEAYCMPLILPIEEIAVKKGEKLALKISYKMCEGLKNLKYEVQKVK